MNDIRIVLFPNPEGEFMSTTRVLSFAGALFILGGLVAAILSEVAANREEDARTEVQEIGRKYDILFLNYERAEVSSANVRNMLTSVLLLESIGGADDVVQSLGEETVDQIEAAVGFMSMAGGTEQPASVEVQDYRALGSFNSLMGGLTVDFATNISKNVADRESAEEVQDLQRRRTRRFRLLGHTLNILGIALLSLRDLR